MTLLLHNEMTAKRMLFPMAARGEKGLEPRLE